ncbi:enoyl-CoA hydratase/isomerase family protein [Nocardia sp. NPDC050799]|uniref:enoyl-CoA hydratase/isomerase family protein n=1 Tax=Nocardia sp. NPDC050799 TaxID=3154842 RepID=UPI0033D0AC77
MAVVRYERTDDIGHLVLCNPPHNLLGVAFYEDMRDSLHQAASDTTRALLVRAEGPNFTSGGDIAAFATMPPGEFRLLASEYHKAFRAIEALHIPTVAAVRGSVFGGGVEIALACDIVVAADDAEFRQIEVSVGSMPIAGGVQRFAERVGRARAAKYAMLSLPLDGRTAAEFGLVAYSAPEDKVEAEALSIATRLASGPTRSYAAVRQILKVWSGGGVPAADAAMLDIAMPLHGTEDAKRGRIARSEALARGVEAAPVVFEGR